MYEKYIRDFSEEHNLCEEALESVTDNLSVIEKENKAYVLDNAMKILYDRKSEDARIYLGMLDDLSKTLPINKFEMYLLFYIIASENAKKMLKEKNVPESIIKATFDDIVFKAYECRNVKGFYGISRPAWLFNFFRGNRFMLGRLQFELTTLEDCVTCDGHKFIPGDRIIKIHIPDNGKPFDRSSRYDAYRRAHEFFRKDFDTVRIPFLCESWLLSPLNRKFLGEQSNIVDFSHEFKIYKVTDNQNMSSVWIFGVESWQTPDELPENNRLRKNYKKWLQSGNSIESGSGIFVFDGQNICNK